VSIIAHSLGTIVTYNILCLQEIWKSLKFNVENYFALGSPLGLFASVYAEENYIRRKVPFCKNFYNLYHPSDLIAYRVEPVMKDNSEDLDPQNVKEAVMVPCHYSAGLN
jgi:hypothetical protein